MDWGEVLAETEAKIAAAREDADAAWAAAKRYVLVAVVVAFAIGAVFGALFF